MNSYWMKVGGDSRQVLTYLSSIYAPIVTYCGETKIERKYPPGQIELYSPLADPPDLVITYGRESEDFLRRRHRRVRNK